MKDVSHAGVTHGFLDGTPPLFASYHAPSTRAGARNIAYVVCQPIHLDLIQSYRSMRRCAEELASAGFHVMRVDYDGTGESVGATDRDAGRVAAWLESVRRAVAVMAAIPGVDGVGLVGVRLGGAFALETSTRLDIAQLVLWEPSAGAHYGREMEILASSSPQRAQAGESSEPTAGLVVAGGYGLSEQTMAELRPLDLEKMQPRGKPDVLLVQRDDRKASPRLQQALERHGCQTTAAQLPGHKEMMVMPQKSVVPTVILAAIRDWALERSHVVEAGEGARPTAVTLAPEAIVDGVRWRPIWFGAADHLFGVLTEPVDGAKPGLSAVLLLTGGVTPRTAGNGSYVALARRLAAKGHAVLRMDVSNIGESGTPDGSPGKENDPFPPSIVDDARAGLERLCTAVAKGTQVWVLGLCSGAYAAFHTIHEDRRTRGVFFLNPERFQLHDADGGDGASDVAPAMSTVDQLEQMNRYWQVMRSAESWKKLLSGKADVRYLANVVRARVASKVASTTERIAVRLGREPKGLAADFGKLLASGVSVNLVFSEGDPGHAAVVTELGVRLDELLGKGMLVKIFPGADHNFHEMTTRGELLDWVESTIS
jgi:dienelactone hydrolase